MMSQGKPLTQTLEWEVNVENLSLQGAEAQEKLAPAATHTHIPEFLLIDRYYCSFWVVILPTTLNCLTCTSYSVLNWKLNRNPRHIVKALPLHVAVSSPVLCPTYSSLFVLPRLPGPSPHLKGNTGLYLVARLDTAVWKSSHASNMWQTAVHLICFPSVRAHCSILSNKYLKIITLYIVPGFFIVLWKRLTPVSVTPSLLEAEVSGYAILHPLESTCGQ